MYVYLDRDGISSLYAQTTDRVEVAVEKERQRGKAGSVKGKLGLGPALRLLLGWVDVAAEAEASLSRAEVERIKSEMTIEHKLGALIRYLNVFENDRYFDDLHRAMQQCDQLSQSVYVNTEAIFDMPQFYIGQRGVDDVNRKRSVRFECVGCRSDLDPIIEENHDYSDNYFKRLPSNERRRILMAASIEKFTRVIEGTMRLTGHDAMYFGGRRGRAVPLGVFGHLNQINSRFYQVKPFAIWVD